MRVIDLLNKIANSEELPLKVRCRNLTFTKTNSKCSIDLYQTEDHDRIIDFCELNEELFIVDDVSKDDLEDRLNRAIEYIEEDVINEFELLAILKGDSNE